MITDWKTITAALTSKQRKHLTKRRLVKHVSEHPVKKGYITTIIFISFNEENVIISDLLIKLIIFNLRGEKYFHRVF